MAMSNVELYEALKVSVGEAAARMIAEVIPPRRDLATKFDVGRLEVMILEVKAELIDRIAQSESRIMGQLWVMFVPLWVGVFGLIATLIAKG